MRVTFTGSINDSCDDELLTTLCCVCSFCSDVSIAEQFANEQLIKFLLEQLESPSSSRQAQEDCLRILDGIVDTAKGKRVRYI